MYLCDISVLLISIAATDTTQPTRIACPVFFDLIQESYNDGHKTPLPPWKLMKLAFAKLSVVD